MKTVILSLILFVSTLANASLAAPGKSLAENVLASIGQAQFLIEKAIKKYEGVTQLPTLAIQWNSIQCLQSPTSEIGDPESSGVCLVSAIGFQMKAEAAIILQRHTMLANVIYVDTE